jgi:serine O-acetyltransferase
MEDYSSYKRPLLSQGFWAIAFHRYGTSVRTIGFAPIRLPLMATHWILIKLSECLFGIYIGSKAQIGSRFVIEHFGCIIIHPEVKIGDDVRIRQGVTIGNKSADAPGDVPTLGDRVDIGAGAKILGKIQIGDGATIGANAVVITDVPPGALAVGVPAKIKLRNDPSMK